MLLTVGSLRCLLWRKDNKTHKKTQIKQSINAGTETDSARKQVYTLHAHILTFTLQMFCSLQNSAADH